MKPYSRLLSSLSPNTDNNTVQVRVTRVWEAINKRTGAPLHTNIILLDEKENETLAIVRNNQKQVYMSKLNEGEVYNISNVKVVPGPKQYKPVESEYSVNFFYKTKVERLLEHPPIPTYKFNLTSFADVQNKVGDVSLLIDVLGMVKSYGKMESRANGARKMDLVLNNDREEIMVITLWEEKASQFLESLPSSNEAPVLVVVTGLLAKKFSAAASLSSTDATRTYVNIEYEGMASLKTSLETSQTGKEMRLQPPMMEHFVNPSGDIKQNLSISEILETTIPDGTQVIRCVFRAKIVAILDGNGWYYDCCPNCARALRDMDGKFYCLACEDEPEKLEQRYRIVAQVEDTTGTTSVTLFNKEAEQLVGIPLRKILAEPDKEGNIGLAPPAIKNVIGKVCAFQIKITPYNIIRGCEEYTVTRVSEVTEEDGMDPKKSTTSDTSETTKSSRKKQRVE